MSSHPLAFKEAKEVTEKLPSTIKEGISKEDANAIAEKFKEVGATVEIKYRFQYTKEFYVF